LVQFPHLPQGGGSGAVLPPFHEEEQGRSQDFFFGRAKLGTY